MAWWLQAQRCGFKLDPTDEQCMVYLYSKDKGWEGPCDLIEICDQVYTKPPWEYHSCTAFPGGEKYFCFTELKKMNQNQNQNRVARTVGSYGTWHESNCKSISGENNCIIGFKKLLNFKVKGEGTDWLMHEFSLPEKGNNEVLCVIQKKKKKGEEMCSAYDTDHKFDPNSFLEHESTASAGGAPCPPPALDSEEEETRPSKKMRPESPDPKFYDDHFSGRDPCPPPALDSEEEKILPTDITTKEWEC